MTNEQARSPFAPDLENIAELGNAGCVPPPPPPVFFEEKVI